MADRWAIAYDLDVDAANQAAANGGVTIQTVYNRIRACITGNGFQATQWSVYAMDETENSLVRVYQAIQALAAIPERQFITRLHVFKVDGALNDVLTLVDNRPSQPV